MTFALLRRAHDQHQRSYRPKSAGKRVARFVGAYPLGNRRPSRERSCRGGRVLWVHTPGLSDFVNRGPRYSRNRSMTPDGQVRVARFVGAYPLGIRRPPRERSCRGGRVLWVHTPGLSDFVDRGPRCSKGGWMTGLGFRREFCNRGNSVRSGTRVGLG